MHKVIKTLNGGTISTYENAYPSPNLQLNLTSKRGITLVAVLGQAEQLELLEHLRKHETTTNRDTQP